MLWNTARGEKASSNVGCCVIPPRAPLLFLCLGPHVTVGYFLWWLARINRSSNVHPVGQQLQDWWDFIWLISPSLFGHRHGENEEKGVYSMRNVTCDCRYGTGTVQTSGLYEDYIWCLNVSCCMQRKPVFFLPLSALRSLCCMSFWPLLPESACRVAVSVPQRVLPSSLRSRSSLHDIYGLVVSVRLHACSL